MAQAVKDAAQYGKKSSDVVLKQVTKIFQQPDTGKDFVAVDHIDLHTGQCLRIDRHAPCILFQNSVFPVSARIDTV